MSTSESFDETVLQGLLEIDQSINYKYRQSKAPKFIKDFFAKRSRKKLKKTIDSYTKMRSLPRSELLYYINQINDIYGGKYLHMKRIEHINDVDDIFATFLIPIEETGWHIYTILSIKNNYSFEKFIFTYSMTNENNLVVSRFSNEFEAFCNNLKRHERMQFPWKFEDQNNCIMDMVTATIISDIKTFLNEMIERSERISNDKL